MGNSDEVQTPKGLFATGDTGLYLNHYIANYKGGRNESFMYGSDKSTKWFDYDLASAYTTGMIHLSLPDYKRGVLIDSNNLAQMSSKDLLSGYFAINGSFKFPKNTIFPSIPCYLDKSTTVYPLQGDCMLTGPEYLLARQQKCEFVIKSVFYIPPKEVVTRLRGREYKHSVKPFEDIIHELQSKRREFPKGHVMNTLYKELANSIYGNLVRGMSNKKSFDTKTGNMLRVTATDLSNPILAS
jgi:hypothetical protein